MDKHDLRMIILIVLLFISIICFVFMSVGFLNNDYYYMTIGLIGNLLCLGVNYILGKIWKD